MASNLDEIPDKSIESSTNNYVLTQNTGIGYNFISNFYKSFSGTDTLVFILMPGSNPVVLGSITTISYSMYRTKQPVINLGRTNINGITRGARVFAGSIIFTMINQHWLKELQDDEHLQWLSGYEELKSDELPLFDLMIVSANEYGSYVSMFIYGVDITDEGQVVSVNDLFTENTCSFVARDIETFTAGKVNPKYAKSSFEGNIIVTSVTPRGWDFIKSDFLNMVDNTDSNLWDFSKSNFLTTTANLPEGKEYDYSDVPYEQYLKSRSYSYKQHQNELEIERLQTLNGFIRDLEYRPFNPMVGGDVQLVQLALRELDLTEYISNLYDLTTSDAVRLFQSNNGLTPNGIVDSRTYIALMTESSAGERILGNVINKNGAQVYSIPDNTGNVVDIISYGQNIEIIELVKEFYKIKEGYISINDVYSFYHDKNDYELPTIKFYDTGYYVLILQQLLIAIYNFTYTPGVYDTETERIVMQIQTENNIVCTLGEVNEDTWKVIENLSNFTVSNQITTNNVSVLVQNAQGEYAVTSNSLDTPLMNGFNASIISTKPVTIKATCIAYYSDNQTEVLVKQFITKANTVSNIDFTEFKNLFTYSLEHKGIPIKIEYIIYPANNNPMKWVIHYSI